MSIRVDAGNTQIGSALIETTNLREKVNQRTEETATPTSAIDRVTLTPAADTRNLTKAVAQSSSVDQAKVDSIRQSLVDGRFQIDSRTVASNLIDMERGLSG